MIHFPDCTIFDMPQRSEAWHEIRRDKLTGSQMGAWLAEKPEVRITVDEIKAKLESEGIEFKKSSSKPELLKLLPPELLPEPMLLKVSTDAREKAICQVLGAMSKCQVPDEWEIDPDGPPPRNPALWAVWNGIRLEPDAREVFERETGLTVREVGFCRHKSKASGCSPDGLIVGVNEGVEFKCPIPSTHVRYLRGKVLPDEYREQVHGNMAVTGASAWWFQSYCPGLPTFRLRIERETHTEAMREGLESFAVELDKARLEMAELWNQTTEETSGVIE
jgi:hypothetical protein